MVYQKVKQFLNQYTLLKQEDNNSIDIDEDYFNEPCSQDSSNWYQKIFYLWVGKLIWRGYKSPLQLHDISDLPENIKIENNLKYFKHINYNSKFPLIYHCYKEFTRRNYSIIIYKSITITFSLVSSYILKLFLGYIQLPTSIKSIELVLSLSLFLSFLITSASQQYGYWVGLANALQIRGSLFSLILEKLFKSNNSSIRKYGSGMVMNLISVDVDTFFEYFWDAHVEIILNPIHILLLLIFLYSLVGVAGLFGFLVMIFILPLATYFSSKSSQHYLKSLNYSDKRVGLIGELIGGIRLLKLYAWEKIFLDRIEETRNPQLSEIFKMVLFWVISNLLTQCLGPIVLLVTFSFYSLLGNELDVTIAFTSLMIFVNLRRPVELLPLWIQRLLKLVASSKRIEEFLRSPEIIVQIDYINRSEGQLNQDVLLENTYLDWNDGNKINNDEEIDYLENCNDDQIDDILMGGVNLDTITIKNTKEVELNQNNLGFSDINETSTSKLININFKAPSGKLTMICGPVGCGKTTLIHSLIGEIYKVKGTIKSYKSIGYTTQQPFLQSASLRENILFGKEYNRERYLKVLEACALHIDLNQLPARDHTEIGERGINLSGGQKSRIALARAIYSNPDCLILDDPLNAVDSEVAKHLFDNCLQGLMANKTRILVTHQLQFLPHADYIAVFQNDTIIQGTYQELKEKGINFESLLKDKQMGLEDKENEDHPTIQSSPEINSILIPIVELIKDDIDNDKDLLSKAKLIIKEDRNEGAVGLITYKRFVKAGGSLFSFVLILLLYGLSQVAFQSSDFWLAIWTQQKLSNHHPNSFYLFIYFGFISTFILLIGCRYMMILKFIYNCSKYIHRQLLQSVTYAPCNFFDTNPSGRILNRFSKDITDVDSGILPFISDFLYCFSTVITSILLMVFVNPLIIVPLLFLMVFYHWIQKVYRSSSRELKRLESISRSPIYAIAQESLNGIVTIRSLRQESRFVQEIRYRVNINQRLYFYSYAVNRWVGFRMDLTGAFALLFASLFAVYQSGNPGLASLSITTAIGLSDYLNWAVRTFTEVEVKMNSVERLFQYIDTPAEDSKIKEIHETQNITSIQDLPKDWPEHGKIEFQDLEIKYRDNMDPVIKNINISIDSKEKIGIVGRTGAGKSTLGWALFRLMEATKGKILIDGIDISRVSLYDLRNRLGVVPQDPFIFSGTLRLNIDPFNQYTDEEIWNSLEQVQLKKKVQSLPMKLNSQMNEAGVGLSIGERQLLCLSRNLLKHSKIILLDESSASLDFATDQIIKTVIRNNFKDSTVLTIAHRLDTIVDSNRILVVDAGKIVEFDSPENLISNRSSKFSQLVYAQSNHFK